MIGLNRSRDTIKDRSYQRRHHKRYPPSKTPVFKRFLSQILTLIPQFVYNVQSRMFWTNWHISEAQKNCINLKKRFRKTSCSRAEKYLCMLSLQMDAFCLSVLPHFLDRDPLCLCVCDIYACDNHFLIRLISLNCFQFALATVLLQQKWICWHEEGLLFI